MRDDLFGSLLAMILFALFMLAPGFVLGWMANIRNFRQEPAIWRLLWSLPLTIGVMPIVTYLAGSVFGMNAVWALYAICLIIGVVLLFLRRRNPATKWPRWLLLIGAGWMMVAVLSGIDIQWGTRLYPSVLIYDFNLRSSLIDGISRQGLPAVNPLFYPGHFVPLRYHYFWFIPCSLVEQIGGQFVTPRHVLSGGNVWCGWALIATVLLYLRYFRRGGDPLGRRGMWACLLLGTAGLDVLPNALMAASRWFTGAGVVFPSAEWWNNPLTGFPHASLWVAHHVACVIACFTGFVLLWRPEANRRHWPILLAGACFASAIGLSIYVTLAFAVSMLIWVAWAALDRRWRIAMDCALAGAVAAVLGGAFLRDMSTTPGAGGSFLGITVRSFTPLESLLRTLDWNWPAVAAANLVFLPLNYFIEAALLTIAVWLLVRRRIRIGIHTDEARAELVLLAVPMLIATFLRSGVIVNNDLGWRAPLLSQTMAIVAGVDILRALIQRGQNVRVRSFVVALLTLGLVSSVWDLLAMRTYTMLADAGWAQAAPWLGGKDIGMRAYAMRDLYEDLNRRIPRNAVVQANPKVWNQVFLGAYSQHQTASFEYGCGTVMGGLSSDCMKFQPAFIKVFNDPAPINPSAVEATCRATGVDVLVFEQSDRAARGIDNSLRILAGNGYARAVSCLDHTESARLAP